MGLDIYNPWKTGEFKRDPLTGRCQRYKPDTLWQWLRWWVRHRLLKPWLIWRPSDTYYRWRYGLENLLVYGPIIWSDREWDWSGMVRVWERQFQRRAEYEAKYGHHTTSAEDAKTLRQCAELCRRILRNTYHVNSRATPWADAELFKNGQWRGTFWAIHGQKQSQRDQEYLGKLIGKNLQSWWD